MLGLLVLLGGRETEAVEEDEVVARRRRRRRTRKGSLFSVWKGTFSAKGHIEIE
jgi:hypothetical protein